MNLTKARSYLLRALFGSLGLLAIDLVLPLGWDDQLFQSMALDLLHYHGLPYIGSWAHDFPGIVYIHWLSIIVFGDSHFGFRTFDVLLHIIMSGLLFILLRFWLNDRTALIAVLFYNLRYVAGGFALASQRDTYAMFFLVLGTLLLLRGIRRNSEPLYHILYLGGSGMALALVGSIRATYISFLLVPLLFIRLRSEDRKKDIAAYTVGGLIIAIAFVLPYLFIPGGVREAYIAVFQYNIDIYGPIHSSLHDLLHQIRTQKWFIFAGLLGVLISLNSFLGRRLSVVGTKSLAKPERVLILGYAIRGLASLMVMGKFMPCHFEPIFLILIPFAALFTEGVLIKVSNVYIRRSVVALLLVYAFFRIYPFPLFRSVIENIGNDRLIENLQDASVSEPMFRSSVDRSIANYINKFSPSNARFESCSLTSGIRWLTHRESATRFTTFYPLDMPLPSGLQPQYQLGWRREFIDSLESARPYFIVIGDGPKGSLDWVKETPLAAVHKIKGFDELIGSHYLFDTMIGGFFIYRRNSN